MTHPIQIDWSFDDITTHTENTESAKFTKLSPMTLADEISEISAPLVHPIGAISIQIVGISAGYECFIKNARQNGETAYVSNADRCLFIIVAVMLLLTYACIKYRLPRILIWVPIILAAFTAWLVMEWSLFLT